MSRRLRMVASLETAGERLRVDCSIPWVSRLLRESAGDRLQAEADGRATLEIRVEAERGPFDLNGWDPLTRSAWARGRDVVIENACTAGFDVHVTIQGGIPIFTFRWRPPARDRVAGRVLRSRFHLLARAVLVQYPALWWASGRGRAPLHASVCTAGATTPLLAGPGGIGKSTLLSRELSAGGRAISDNLCVGDGWTAWGLVEPLRVEGSGGRKMPHGRREAAMPGRVAAMVPDRLVVLRRSTRDVPVVRPIDAETGMRSLVTGTYVAGELRRFWAFAATLTAGSGVGPPHPSVREVASSFAARLPCIEILLGRRTGERLADLLTSREALAWT